jgi:hypothetical protein
MMEQVRPCIDIKNVFVHGLHNAISFRRSFNSFDKSDSHFHVECDFDNDYGHDYFESVKLGESDKKRLADLVKNGDSHAKVCRKIWVDLDLTLPRRVWVDFDTYRLGRCESINAEDIEYMSDSTMHTISKRFLKREDFSYYVYQDFIDILNELIEEYQDMRKYKVSSDELRKQLIRIKDNLPESFKQTRSLSINYQAIRHIKLDRKGHLQPEFDVFIAEMDKLPYADILIG